MQVKIECEGEVIETTLAKFLDDNEELQDFAREIEDCLRAGSEWEFGGGASPYFTVEAA